MHARQDLQAFKELLAATKSLLAEHSSRDRSMGSYQSGGFGKLPSVLLMVAYEQVTAQLNDRGGHYSLAYERVIKCAWIISPKNEPQGLESCLEPGHSCRAIGAGPCPEGLLAYCGANA